MCPEKGSSEVHYQIYSLVLALVCEAIVHRFTGNKMIFKKAPKEYCISFHVIKSKTKDRQIKNVVKAWQGHF